MTGAPGGSAAGAGGNSGGGSAGAPDPDRQGAEPPGSWTPVPDEGERGEAMELRVVRTARDLGMDPEQAEILARAHSLAMGPRRRVLAGDREPRFLHPGRTALILMDDLDETSALHLQGAMLVDSEDEELEVEGREVTRSLGPEVTELRDSVPVPRSRGERLLEDLLVADAAVQRIALAERLDHLRHAHLWQDPERRRRAHAQAEEVYLPLSGRVHPTLERRYRWWCRMFGRRYV